MSGQKVSAAAKAKRTLANKAQFYNGRQEAAATNRDLAAVQVDRARAVAAQIEQTTGDDTVWYSLAEALSRWCGAHGA